MICVTTNDRSASIWANSHHLCGELLTELDDQRINHCASSDAKDKEEGEGRIKSDYEDQSKIKTALDKCIHPLEVKSHASNVLVNIYTGKESDKSTNVYKAAELGEEQMQQFQKGLPDGFRNTLTTKVVLLTSAKDKEKKEKDKENSYNTDLIFLCVLLILGTNQIDFEDLFDFELAAVPALLFEESGVTRYPKNKSVLLNKLKVQESSRCIKPDATVIDGAGMLHKVHWSPNGIVKDLVDGIDHYVRILMLNTDVYLMFDHYKTGSIKSDTRAARVAAFRISHHLSLERELPPKDMVLSSSLTKENLIETIPSELCTRFETNKSPKCFLVTLKNSVPEQVRHGVITKRRDLTLQYDEADYIMPQQVHSILKEEGKKSVKVLSSDTDVFVLLCFLFANHWAPKDVYMDPFSGGSKLISIKKSVNAKQHIIPSLVALHAIS